VTGQSRNVWRRLLACCWGTLLAVPALAGPSEELDKAVRLYNEGRYQQSQEVLLDIDRDALANERKQHRDELVGAVRTAINQANKAKQNLDDADKAFAAGQTRRAEKFYDAVASNDYASASQKQRAREGLALIAQQQELKRKLAKPPAATQPADSARAPGTQPATRPAQDQAKYDKARLARNRARAGELIRAGDAAIHAGQYDRAESQFAQALQLVPNHPQALNGRELVRRHRQVERPAGLLDQSVKRRRGRWMRTETRYGESEREIRRSINEHEYAQAREKLQMARRLLEAARRDAEPPDRYRFLIRQVESLMRFIEAEEGAYNQQQAAAKRRIAIEQERHRRDGVRKEKDARIAQLMDQVMQLQKEREYGQAADVLREILAVDPTYQNAEFLLKMVEDADLIQDQKDNRKTFRDRFQEAVLEVEKTRTPATVGVDDRFVVYPDEDEWRMIANRDPFGAGLTSESDADRRVREQLDTVIPPVEFDEGAFFEDVIEFLREVSKTSISVSWNALEILGIDRTTPTGGLDLREVKLETALNILLDNVGGLDADLAFDVVDGVIQISTDEELSTHTITRVYDVRDLLIKVRSFEAPNQGMGGMMGGMGGGMGGMGGGMGGMGGGMGGMGGGMGGMGGGMGGGGGGYGDDDDDSSEEEREEIVDELQELIMNQIMPGTWVPDGVIGSMDIWNDRMIVTHTARAHRQLVDLFTQLRESKDIQVMVEARFITLRSNFLEEIGVDLDVVLNAGNAGYDQALSQGAPVVDPRTGQLLIHPRRFTSLGQVPQAAALGGAALGAATALEQPFANVALVPPGSPSNYWSRHTTPIPLINNTLGLAGPPATSVPGNLAGVARDSGPAFSMFGSFLDNIQVDFLLRATQMDTRGSSVDAPRLVCYNGRSGFVEVNTMVSYVATPGFVPSGGVWGGQSSQGMLPQIGTLPRGRTFTVTPTVSGDRKYVTMELEPMITDATLRSIPVQQGALASYFQVPEFQRTRIKTTVSVPDEGTLLLGGLKLSAEEEVEAGVPIISKIPILKRAFTNRSRTRDEFVLLVLIKPTIIIPQEQEDRAFPDLITSDSAGF